MVSNEEKMLEFLIYGVTVVICVIFGLLYLLSGGHQRPTLPGMKPVDALKGNLPDIMRAGSLHEFLMDIHKTYGPIVSFWWGPKMTVSIASPQLFKEHSKPFDRPVEFYEMFRPMIGQESIQFANGSDAQRRHAALSRCFKSEAMKTYYDLFNQLSKDVVDKWSELPADEHIPLGPCMFDYTIRAMLQGAFGNFFSNAAKVQQLRQAYDYQWLFMEESLRSGASDTTNLDQKQIGEQIKIIHDMILDCMKFRRQNPPSAAEYLAIDAVLELDMTEETTKCDLVAMLLGGFHTTALALIWALYFIANNADVQDKVCEELTRILGDEMPDMDNMNDLTYLQQVVDETIRCSSLSVIAARVQDCEINLGGHTIPAETPVIQAFGVVHQDTVLYPDPTRFDPERFNPENVKARPNFSFEPFGFAGKRKCPGYRFSLVEVKVLLCTMLRKFKVSLVEGQVITPVYGLVTSPKDEIWMTITKRGN